MPPKHQFSKYSWYTSHSLEWAMASTPLPPGLDDHLPMQHKCILTILT